MRDSHAALKAGMSLEEFERAREQRVQRWIALFHSEMERTRADGFPNRGIPTILVKVEEFCIAAARAVAKRPVTDRNSAGDPADRREKSPCSPASVFFLWQSRYVTCCRKA